eukprot:Nk52_evm7s377 gene=Nk52_evmTU7s377
MDRIPNVQCPIVGPRARPTKFKCAETFASEADANEKRGGESVNEGNQPNVKTYTVGFTKKWRDAWCSCAAAKMGRLCIHIRKALEYCKSHQLALPHQELNGIHKKRETG